MLLGILILVAVAVISALMLLPGVAGGQILKMDSSAMEPVISKNSLLIIERKVPEEIQTGDVIAFKRNGQTEIRRVTVNHLVSEDYSVKGDAFSMEDADNVKYASLIGRVRYQVPVLGSLAFIFETGIGRIYTAAFALCGFLMILLSVSMRRAGREALLLKKLKAEGYLDKVE